MNHRHGRPDTAAMQAILDTGRAVLAADPERAVEAAAGVRCPVCVAVCAVQFGFTLCVSLSGEQFMSEQLRARLLAAIEVAERELHAAPN